jgi:hypothetical protein
MKSTPAKKYFITLEIMTADGKLIQGPATRSLRSYEVSDLNGSIVIRGV